VRYRAFISYSHADAATAAWLHRKLEAWRVPARMRAENPALPDKLAPVFRDREELGSAGELGPQIQHALDESEALIVLCSPEGARSRWVDTEVHSFRASGRGERVFALIVAGEPHSGDERECFPASLRESEPLAADLRPGKDGKELALLKLIAGLLGVPLDTLRQREARRRHQRMLAVTSLALVVMLVTSVLAVQASIARAAAERRQKQAEALVDFMLGDLNDKLAEVSRLDILEGVHDHAMDYFQSLPAGDVTDEALQQRARALTRIGNVRLDQGHVDKALVAYLAAQKFSSRLATAAPGNLQRQLSHAEVVSFVGVAHWYLGQLEQAQASFDAAGAVLLRAQAIAPRDPKLLYQLSSIDNNSGHVLEGQGRIEEATRYYERMLGATKQLVALDPKVLDSQNQLGLAHNNLAKMALLRGDIAGAVVGYRADVAIEDDLLRRDPRNNAQAERLLLAQGALGRTLALAGDGDGAVAMLQFAVDTAERLHRGEPDSASFEEDIPTYAIPLARLQRVRGDLASARALATRARAVSESLLAKSPDQSSWKRMRAEAIAEQGQQALLAKDTAAAKAAADAALALLEPMLAQQPQDRALLLATAGAQLLAAASSADPAPKARAALAACNAQPAAARDPRVRALRVEAWLGLGDRARAQTLIAGLLQDGYREPGLLAMLRSRAIPVPALAAAP
jgi:tetratricopeptide (TPR) repeat protein